MKLLSTLVLSASLVIAPVASAQIQVTDRSQMTGATTLEWNARPTINSFRVGTGIPGVTVEVTANPFVGWYGPCQAGGCWSGGFTNGEKVLFASSVRRYTFTFSDYITGFATQAWFNPPGGGALVFQAFDGEAMVASSSAWTGGGFDANLNQATLYGVQGARFNRVEFIGDNEYAINQLTLLGVPRGRSGPAGPNAPNGPTGPSGPSGPNEPTPGPTGPINPTSTVPEPSTWALMTIGLGTLGVASRRRRR